MQIANAIKRYAKNETSVQLGNNGSNNICNRNVHACNNVRWAKQQCMNSN